MMKMKQMLAIMAGIQGKISVHKVGENSSFGRNGSVHIRRVNHLANNHYSTILLRVNLLSISTLALLDHRG